MMKPNLWSPPVTEDMRDKIRTIGMMVSEELPSVTLELPAKGTASGAGRKAWKWVNDWWAEGAGLAFIPFVAAAGAAKGAIEAPSTETVESQEGQVRGALVGESLIRQLEHQAFTQVTERTDVMASIVPQDDSGQANRRETGPASRVPQPDAMLRIQLQSIELRGELGVNQPLALIVEAQVTLTAPSAATPLYTHNFQYVTGARRLSEWAAEDAKPFREALDLSLARLAEWMVDELFLTYSFAHEHPRATLQTTDTR